MAVFFRERLGQPQSHTARDDSYFMYGVRAGRQ